MQKIIIKNFGAIKEAEIDIPKTLVLIGEQASGKSTIAKLIYFFQTLPNEFISTIITSDTDIDSEKIVKSNFESYLNNMQADTFIEFHYSDEINIRIISDSTEDIKITFSNLFIESIKGIKQKYQPTISQINDLKKATISQLKDLTNSYIDVQLTKLQSLMLIDAANIFKLGFENSLFIIAGRSMTVSFSDLFEKQLYSYLDGQKEKGLQSLDEILTQRFLKRVSIIKNYFSNLGGSFADIPKGDKSEITDKAELKIAKILKGKYIINGGGSEKLNLENGKSITLNQASSGQQEAIRILQELFIGIVRKTPVLRVIEEPEAHLFPIAQKQIIELFALMVNQNENSRLIITTHSPYILSSLNNLLFASRVVEKNPDAESEVADIVDKDFRLKATDFAAYTLRFTEGGFVSESIMSDRGVIKQNYLDTVSEMLSYEFNHLRTIHAKTFVQK